MASAKSKKKNKPKVPKKTKKNTKSKSVLKSQSLQKTLKWPTERNVFFRPDRMKYVRKIEKPQGCVFCHSAAGDISLETLCVFKTKYSQIILNKYPYNNGHLLILPLQHVGDILSLSPDRYNDLHNTLRLAIEAVKTVYNPNGFNIGLNHGSSGGAGIPEHLHYHVVPRWNGDLNFFPLIANTKLVIETLEMTYEKYIQFFSERSV